MPETSSSWGWGFHQKDNAPFFSGVPCRHTGLRDGPGQGNSQRSIAICREQLVGPCHHVQNPVGALAHTPLPPLDFYKPPDGREVTAPILEIWASRPEFRVLSLGLPGDTRLLGKTVQTEIFQQRGGAVKALTPRARPFCDRQVGELRECANRGRNTWFPAPSSPSSLTCGPQPSAAPTRCGSLGTH